MHGVLIWILSKCKLYAYIYLQHRSLQASAFTGTIREAHALDWDCRHQRPVCGGRQTEETFSCGACRSHSAWCGGETYSRKGAWSQFQGGLRQISCAL